MSFFQKEDITNFRELALQVGKIEKRFLSKRVSIIWFAIFAICLIGLGAYTVSLNKEKNSLVSSMTNRISELEITLDGTESRLRFISLADSLVAASGSDLDTIERHIYVNALWNYGKEFNVDPYLGLMLGQAESGWRKFAKNHGSTATGINQITLGTWKSCKAMLSETYLDIERTDLEHQVKYSMFYLRLLYDDCGSWPVAFTRYNMGYTTEVNGYSNNIFAKTKKLKGE